ncbi:MAG: hypothetical protein KUG81_06505, partial [Gammaproteobacteria bacterium]|nr:hypothetical protein [Gammaproteobacteria bacterium]
DVYKRQVVDHTEMDSSLIIEKLVLTDDPDFYVTYGGCKVIKEMNGKFLVMERFGIKLKTLSQVTEWLTRTSK